MRSSRCGTAANSVERSWVEVPDRIVDNLSLGLEFLLQTASFCRLMII